MQNIFTPYLTATRPYHRPLLATLLLFLLLLLAKSASAQSITPSSLTVCAGTNGVQFTATYVNSNNPNVVGWEYSSNNGSSWTSVSGFTLSYNSSNSTTTSTLTLPNNIQPTSTGLYRAIFAKTTGAQASRYSVPSPSGNLTVNPLPTANAGADQTKCATGTSTTFNLTGVTANGTFNWSVVSGNATINDPASATPVVTVTGSGLATIRLTTTSNQTPSCGTVTDDVVLRVNPVPTADAGADQEKCATGTSTTFNLTGVTANGTHNWTVVSGSATITNPTSATPVVTVTGTSGVATIRLTTTSNQTPSCGTATDEVVLTVNPIPTVTLNSTATCTGGTFTLTATAASGTTPYTYAWTVPSGVTDPGNVASFTTETPGTYTVTVTGAKGCVSTTASRTIAFTTIPTATIIPPGTLTICAGNNIALEAPAAPTGQTYAYQWYLDNNAITTAGTSRIYTASVAGSYTVVVTNTTGGASCASAPSDPVQVNVNPLPTWTPQLSSTNNYNCGPGMVNLAVSGAPAGHSYRWYTLASGGTLVATGPTFSPNLTTSTTYYVAAVSDQGCEKTLRVAVEAEIRNLPVAAIDPEPAQCASPTPNGTVTFALVGMATNATLVDWQIIQGSSIAQIQDGNTLNPNVVVTGSGTVIVRLNVTSNNGCGTDSEDITLVVNPVPTWTPSADPAQRCGTGPVTLTGLGADPGQTYRWYATGSGGAPLATGNTFSPTLTATGTTLYYVVAFNGTCEGDARTAVAAVANPIITNAVTLNEPAELKYFQPSTYTAVPSNNSLAWTYQWNIIYTTGPEQQTETGAVLNIPANKMHLGFEGVTVVQVAPENSCVDRTNSVLVSSNNNNPLPVELLYLQADQKENNVVALEWATASEKNSEGFEVQVSGDAKNYRTLAFVASKAGGNTNQKQVYTFYDKENGKYGTRYYRLMQRDMNGDKEYFGPKAVKIGEAVKSMNAYPNPFTSEVNLEITTEGAGSMQLLVTSATGAKVLERTVNVVKGNNREVLRFTSSLPRGLYFVTTHLNGKTSHLKLLKK